MNILIYFMIFKHIKRFAVNYWVKLLNMISTYRGGLGDCASLFFKAPGETALRSFEGDKVKLHLFFLRD